MRSASVLQVEHLDTAYGQTRILKGVTFEVYEDMPGVRWDGDIATMPGLGRSAWFKDSEGNTMCLDQAES